MTTVCATTPTARALMRADAGERMRRGAERWETPDILSWSAWLRRQWDALVIAPPAGLPLLLNARQEQQLWERVIAAAPISAHLIDPSASARLAAEAYTLVAAYRMPAQHALWATVDDAAAFAEWMRAFERECKQAGWMPGARLADRLSAPEAPLELAGFERLTPQQEAHLAAAGSHTRALPALRQGPAEARCYPDAASEWDAAAQWAARRVEAEPTGSIAILDFQLAQNRAGWEEALGRHCEGAFAVGPGVALDALPLVASAVRILELAAAGETVNVNAAGALLLSPFVKGYEAERFARAQADARLRKRSGPHVRLTEAVRHDDCPQLSRVARALVAAHRHLAGEQLPSAWAADFHRVLRDDAGWPGDARLSAAEYPVYEAWRDALSEFATLDVVAGAKGFSAALQLLRATLADTRYEAAPSHAPAIVVVAPESVYGARFDAVWLASMHDAAWPSAPQTNPFIPLAMQRQFGVPAATPSQVLTRARRLTQAWFDAAPEVVVSYAAAGMQDAPQSISPLAAQWPRTMEPPLVVPVADAVLEPFADETGPAAPPGSYTGGATLFKLQAACPFHAFAEMRLNARQLEEPYLGCSPRDHGSVIHVALQYCWDELSGLEGLQALGHDQTEALIERAVAQALTEKWPGSTTVYQRLREVEQERLCLLLRQWLTLERQRLIPFTVLDMENDRVVNLRGLEVNVRADRVDELAGGQRIVILDYKTGVDVKARWTGERPAEPQLPLYAASAERHVAGLALAQVHPKQRKFVGEAESKNALPGKQNALKPGEVAEWRRVMESLADEFLAGKAELMPGEACKFCHLPPFCRKHDGATGDEADGD